MAGVVVSVDTSNEIATISVGKESFELPFSKEEIMDGDEAIFADPEEWVMEYMAGVQIKEDEVEEVVEIIVGETLPYIKDFF